MGLLQQLEGANRILIGWYGDCSDNCATYSLAKQEVYDVIDSVYEIAADGTRVVSFLSYTSSTHSFPQTVTELECGHAYWISLSKGVTGNLKELTIDNLTLADETLNAGCVSKDWSSGGPISIADLTFSSVPTITGSDLEFNFVVETSDLESACTSNLWKYRIKDTTGNTIETSNDLPTSQVNITETVPGGGDYVVEIWGITSSGQVITDVKSEPITIPWPASDFTIVGNINVNYLEWQGPSSSDSVTFSDPQVWVDSISFKKSTLIQNESTWRYKINNGQWENLSDLQDGTSLDVSDVLHFQLKEDLLGADDHDDLTTVSRNWDSEVTIVYIEKNGTTREASLPLIGKVKNRIVDISSWDDKNDTDFKAVLNIGKTQLVRWQYEIEKLNDSQQSFASPRIVVAYSTTKTNTSAQIDMTAWVANEIDPELGPGYYKIYVRGVHDTTNQVVTPVISKVAFLNWPDPIVSISDAVMVEYREYDGPSTEDFLKVATATYVHDLDFNTTNNASDWSYDVNASAGSSSLPTTLPVDLSLGDKINFTLNAGLKAATDPKLFGEDTDKTYTANLEFNYVGKNTLHPDATGTTSLKGKTITGKVIERYLETTNSTAVPYPTTNTISIKVDFKVEEIDKWVWVWKKGSTTELASNTKQPGGYTHTDSGSVVIDLNDVPSNYLSTANNFDFEVIGHNDSPTIHESGWIAGQIAPALQESFTIDWPTTIFTVSNTIADTYVWQGVTATPATNGTSVSITKGWVKKLELKNPVGSDVSSWEYSVDNGSNWNSLTNVDETFAGVVNNVHWSDHTKLKLRLKANLEVDDYGDATVDVVATDVGSNVLTKTINLNGSVTWPTPTFTVTPASTNKGYRETEGPSGHATFQVKTKFIKTGRWKTSGDVHWEYDEATNFATPTTIPTSATPLPTPWADRPYQAGTPFSTQTTTTFYIRLKEGLEVPGADDMKPPLESASFNNILTFLGEDVADNVITRNVSLNGTVTEYPNGCADYDLSFATTGGEVAYDSDGVTLNGFESGGYICVDNFGTSFGTKVVSLQVRDGSNQVVTSGQLITNYDWSTGNNVVYKAPDQMAYEATNFEFGKGTVILTPMNL